MGGWVGGWEDVPWSDAKISVGLSGELVQLILDDCLACCCEEEGGWVGGWVDRGEIGGLNELRYMGGWVGEWVGGWVERRTEPGKESNVGIPSQFQAALTEISHCHILLFGQR